VLLDPDRRLLEDDRAGSAVPAPLQVVLDSADVTVTSSQFGLSGLFVARRRYDYTKDLGLIAYFSNRSVGLHVGPRWHFGPRNDANTYRHNLYGYYTAAALRGDFRDDSRPGRGDDGVLSGLGFRYDFTNQYAWDNPTHETKVRLFADWFGGGLGSDYDFVDWGVRMSFVRPLLTHRTLLAVQLMNAFSAPIDSRVPNQARYALGGDLGVRAVPVDERLGEHIALARFELRQTIYPEVDHNFFDWVTFRHGQLRLFVDAGRVEDRRSSLYRPSDYAVGVGIGVAGMYDFMGFFPSVAYLAVAQRIDDVDESGIQFLFGTRQAF
jgi:hemolysin activation/secretion protein